MITKSLNKDISIYIFAYISETYTHSSVKKTSKVQTFSQSGTGTCDFSLCNCTLNHYT